MSNKENHHKINYIEFHSTDIERTKKFYGAVFGWTFQGFGGGPMTDFCQIRDTAGNLLKPLGAVQSRKFNSAPQPVIGFECSITVDDVDAAARAVEANGGKIAMPKAAMPELLSTVRQESGRARRIVSRSSPAR